MIKAYFDGTHTERLPIESLKKMSIDIAFEKGKKPTIRIMLQKRLKNIGYSRTQKSNENLEITCSRHKKMCVFLINI